METSPMICSANQWADFYMIGTSVIKELSNFLWQQKKTSKTSLQILGSKLYSTDK